MLHVTPLHARRHRALKHGGQDDRATDTRSIQPFAFETSGVLSLLRAYEPPPNGPGEKIKLRQKPTGDTLAGRIVSDMTIHRPCKKGKV